MAWDHFADVKSHDAGNRAQVFLGPGDQFIGGGGIGLRLFVPFVNMIRFDLSVGDGVHARFGINEKAVAQRNRVR